MNDKVFIKNLILPCYVGVTDEEQDKSQNVVIDIEILCDLRSAGASDNIKQTVNYFEIKKTVSDTLQKSRYRLLESIAQEVAKLVLKDPNAQAVTIRIIKEKYTQNPVMGIEISRERHE